MLIWLLCLGGFAMLSLAMPRHRRTFQLKPLTARAELALRLAGFSLLLLSLVIILTGPQVANDLVSWFGILTMAALLVALVLTFRKSDIQCK